MHPSTHQYLKPTDAQMAALKEHRQAAAVYQEALEKLPDGPDKTWAIRNHRTTAMWANVTIARNPDGTPRS